MLFVVHYQLYIKKEKVMKKIMLLIVLCIFFGLHFSAACAAEEKSFVVEGKQTLLLGLWHAKEVTYNTYHVTYEQDGTLHGTMERSVKKEFGFLETLVFQILPLFLVFYVSLAILYRNLWNKTMGVYMKGILEDLSFTKMKKVLQIINFKNFSFGIQMIVYALLVDIIFCNQPKVIFCIWLAMPVIAMIHFGRLFNASHASFQEKNGVIKLGETSVFLLRSFLAISVSHSIFIVPIGIWEYDVPQRAHNIHFCFLLMISAAYFVHAIVWRERIYKKYMAKMAKLPNAAAVVA